MATNNTGPAGITYTYDAGVNHTEEVNSNAGPGIHFQGDFSTLNNPYGQAPEDLQTNWFPDDALLNDEDLFGAFMHSSPKSHSSSNTPFPDSPAAAEQNTASKGYCDPRQFLGGAAGHNIDPSLRRLSTTSSPRHSNRVSAAGSAEQYHGDQNDWNLPPIGHSSWKTFPFQDYMTAAGVQINTVPAVPVQEPRQVVPDAITYPNMEPFKFKNPFFIGQGTFGFPLAQDYSQYGQPDYFSRVPGYGLAPDNTTDLPGNPIHLIPFQDDPLQLNPYQFTFPQPTNGQMPIGGNTEVENWIPSSANPFGSGGGIVGGSQAARPGQVPTKPVTTSESRRSSASPSYDSGTSPGPDSPSITPSPKATEAGKRGAMACSRTLAQIKAVRLAQEIYKPRPKPDPLTIESLDGKKRYKFTYSRNAELNGVFTVNELKAYIMHRFAAPTKGSDAQMLIQCVPADSNDRYPTKHVSDKCRFANCIVANRTIKQGTFRVALDEEVDKKLRKRYDPFHVAGFVHLYCLEHFIDLAEIAQKCAIVPDNRKLDARVEGDVSRIHLNKTSASNVRTANDFIVALKSGLKQATGFDGKSFDYNKTLCWKLTRNATVDSKELRQFNAKKRGGINIFVHFNDEKRKIELHEKKNKMKNDALFSEQMGEIMDATIQEAKRDARLDKGLPSSELLSSPNSSSLAKRREEKRTTRTKSVVSSEDARRRSSRLNQAPSPVVPSNQGHKRSLSDADAQGDEDQSPRTLHSVKRIKLNHQQPAPNTGEKHRRPTLGVYDPAAFDFPTQSQSSSGFPMPAPTKSRPQLGLQMPVTRMTVHQEESAPLNPPPPTPIVHSPNVGCKRSRQESVPDSLFGSDSESVRSMRKTKQVKYTR